MLACSSCGRAFNARALNAWSLSTASCPTCGGDLAVTKRREPLEGSRARGRFVSRPAPRDDLEHRLSGLGA